jgi:hypothetical protein
VPDEIGEGIEIGRRDFYFSVLPLSYDGLTGADHSDYFSTFDIIAD